MFEAWAGIGASILLVLLPLARTCFGHLGVRRLLPLAPLLMGVAARGVLWLSLGKLG
jgi:hypothetical protein